jgi:hypothetical protein
MSIDERTGERHLGYEQEREKRRLEWERTE